MRVAFRASSQSELFQSVETFPWARRVWRLDLHHTFDPDHARWWTCGSKAIHEQLRARDRHATGLDDIAQHLTIMPDGEIWSGRDWNATPDSVGQGLSQGAFMIAMVGNFDAGHDRLEGPQLESTIAAIRAVQTRFRLPPQALLFQNELPLAEVTSPGSGIRKGEMLALVGRAHHATLPALADVAHLPAVFKPSSGTAHGAGNRRAVLALTG